MQTLEARLARLERHNRALLATTVAALALAAVATVLALTRPGARAETLTVRALRVEDARGAVRGSGAERPGRIRPGASDAGGRLRGSLGLGRRLAQARLRHSVRATPVELTAFADAAPRLALSNPEGNDFFQVSLSRTARPGWHCRIRTGARAPSSTPARTARRSCCWWTAAASPAPS